MVGVVGFDVERERGGGGGRGFLANPQYFYAFPNSNLSDFLHRIRDVVQPIVDNAPMDVFSSGNSTADTLRHLRGIKELAKVGYKHREVLMPFYELFTGSASQILDRWFEGEMLKTTLATDAVIGANISPKHNGSSYVLLHHVFGEAAGKPGVWAYGETKGRSKGV